MAGQKRRRSELAEVESRITADLSELQHAALLEIHKFILTLPIINGRRQVSRFAVRNAETLHKSRGIGAKTSTIINSRTGVISKQSGLVTRDHSARDAQAGQVASEYKPEELGFTATEFLWLCIPGTWNPWLDAKDGRTPKTPKPRCVSQMLRFGLTERMTNSAQRKRQHSEDAYPTPGTGPHKGPRGKRARREDSEDDESDEMEDLGDTSEDEDEMTPGSEHGQAGADDHAVETIDGASSIASGSIMDADEDQLSDDVNSAPQRQPSSSTGASPVSRSSFDTSISSPSLSPDRQLSFSPHPSMFATLEYRAPVYPSGWVSSMVPITASPLAPRAWPAEELVDPVTLRNTEQLSIIQQDSGVPTIQVTNASTTCASTTRSDHFDYLGRPCDNALGLPASDLPPAINTAAELLTEALARDTAESVPDYVSSPFAWPYASIPYQTSVQLMAQPAVLSRDTRFGRSVAFEHGIRYSPRFTPSCIPSNPGFYSRTGDFDTSSALTTDGAHFMIKCIVPDFTRSAGILPSYIRYDEHLSSPQHPVRHPTAFAQLHNGHTWYEAGSFPLPYRMTANSQPLDLTKSTDATDPAETELARLDAELFHYFDFDGSSQSI